jgi:hydroxymethylpyrimidine pyrophosphatase-like HAD family hydrolase
MYICVDFDGTIVDHRFPEIGEPVPDAVKWLKQLHKCGAKLILYTMRSDGGVMGNALTAAIQYLTSEGVTLFAVNQNPSQREWTSSPKVYAELYIDDAAYGCPLIKPKGFARPCVDWKKVGPQVEHICLSRR